MNKIRVLGLCTLLFCSGDFPGTRQYPFTFTFGISRANAQEAIPAESASLEKNKASILLKWVDARGVVYPGGKIEKMQWIWSRLNPSDPFDSPALRLWISSRLPASWKTTRVSGDGVTVSEPMVQSGDRQTLAVDLRSGKGTLRFDFEDEKKNKSEMSLVIQVNVNRPYVLVRPECGKLDLRFLVHKIKARHLYVGLSCADKDDRFEIFFFRSNDSGWAKGEGLIQFDPNNKFTAFKHTVEKPKDAVVYSQKLFRVGTIDDFGGENEYSVLYNPKIKPKRFYYSAGLGFTVYSYKEELGNLNQKQQSLTGKVNVGYRLIPKVLDIAFNGFGNLVTLNYSPKTFSNGVDLPAARFYGLNGRLGYRLPVGLGATEFMFLTGWYFWGMIVPTASVDPDINSYGIKSLSGPQLFLTMINSAIGKQGYWAYFKFAFISDGFSIQSTGREIAIGGGYELSKVDLKPISLTLDIAHAQFKTPQDRAVQNGMKLFSMTLGAQKTF